MWNKWTAAALILSAVVFTGVDMTRLYPQLPDKLASHFDFQGVPDGWSSKAAFMWAAGLTLLWLGTFLCVIPLTFRFMPTSLINLPDKEYWLGPEQRDATFQFMTTWMFWFAAATLWLLTIVFHAAMVANLQNPPRLMPMWGFLAGFLAFTAGMLFVLIRRFRRVDHNPSTHR